MPILALSTSTHRGSAAVLGDGGGPPPAASYADLRSHAERIFEAIDGALAAANVVRGDLEAIACDVGPGSFTGVRVGVASAKGIAFALGIPLVGVVGLEAMAAAAFATGAAPPDAIVIAAVDAKKGEVFVAAYGLSAGEVVELEAPRHTALGPSAFLPVDRTSSATHARVVVVGEVASSLDPPVPGLVRAPAFDLPDAGWIGHVGRARHRLGLSGDPDRLEPTYVREPDARPTVVTPRANSS